jgi:hypothetical protein
MTNMMKAANILFSLNNKRFILLENKPFVMGVLLLKQLKLDQRSMTFIKNLLIKTFNTNNNKFVEVLYANIITFFGKMDLFNLLGLRKDTIMYKNLLANKRGLLKEIKGINIALFKMSRPTKKTKRYLYLYLCIVNYSFYYIGFPKMVNILRKVLLHSSKEKRTNNLKIILENLKKIYLTRLKINSSYLLIRLISLFLMLKKILESICIMK